MNWRRTVSASGTRSTLPLRHVDAKVAAVITERHRSTLLRRRRGSARGRLRRGRFRIADEAIAIEIGRERRMQPIDGDQLGQPGICAASVPSNRPSVSACDVHFGDAGAVARNAKKLDMHNDERLSQDGSMALTRE